MVDDRLFTLGNWFPWMWGNLERQTILSTELFLWDYFCVYSPFFYTKKSLMFYMMKALSFKPKSVERSQTSYF